YERITAESPFERPMRIYPAPHYTMGGLWVDYNLMTTVDGLYAIGEANFSDHGANRLGASALMQGLADGYFILPYTIGDYLAQAKLPPLDASHPDVRRTEAAVSDREEHQTPEGEAKRDDERFGYVAAWEFRGVGEPAVLHKEPLEFETVHLAQRSYK